MMKVPNLGFSLSNKKLLNTGLNFYKLRSKY